MAAYEIRIIGDPVLREVATDVTDIDGALVRVTEGMIDAMYEAEGLAVAAPQVGVRKRVVVYQMPDDPEPSVIINPRIVESGDEPWLYSEGCLSIPGVYWEISRPKQVHLVGLDLEGNEVSIEADELAARMYQHEIDHLDGVLMTERLDDDQKQDARRVVRELMMSRETGHPAGGGALRLPDVTVAPAALRHPRRLAFLGTPLAAIPSLKALVDGGFDIPLVVSRPDKRRGRGAALTPSPVKAAAVEMGLPVTERVDDVIDVGVDAGVVVAYGAILRPHVLAAVPMVNVHFSLLPRWRGAAPVERALLAGDEVTGVCVMDVVDELDAGGVYASAQVPIGAMSTAADLTAELAGVGADLLVRTLESGLGDPAPQEGDATYADKIHPDDLRLDWTRSVSELDRVVRVGGAWTTFRGRRFRVWSASPRPGDVVPDQPGALHALGAEVTVIAGDGELVLGEVQPEGKSRQPATAWSRGARLAADEMLGA